MAEQVVRAGDGVADLLYHVDTQQPRLQPGDTQATLTAVTSTGIPVQGTDSVQVVAP